ncbi:aminotransferase class V-fold PLP-dependent enzyme [Microbacterium gorillae]|uniref:aminotransferase class V-fold PLP-dependent enzyme n=1 Tax=Microbacterium gorillae TaxID=1231063 RepID=UPI0005916F21|nr:aminotransferase class V-fold PLP-dependent enzyme [Microbacterium gorillae]
MSNVFPLPQPVRFASGVAARDAWPLDPAVVHLNHGSFGAVLTEVGEYQDALRRESDRNPVGWYPRVAERVREARGAIAGFVGATADDTVFVPNASAAATVVFNSLRLEAGDEILVTDHGYGAITMGARRLAARFGARLRTLEIPLAATDPEILELFRTAITPHTRLIVVDQITSPTARTFPTREITDLAHTRGVRVLVDGAHAPGLVADAVAVGGGDWWFGNLHKWPGAPRGSALLVTRAADRDELWPLIDSWGANEPYPGRFDSQGTMDATSYLASPLAVEAIEREYGWVRTRQTMAELADAGARLIGDAMASMVSGEAVADVAAPVPSMRLVRLPDGLGLHREDADDLRMQMYDELGVETAFTSFRGIGYFRLSVHLYTTTDDFQAFVDKCVPSILRKAESRRIGAA